MRAWTAGRWSSSSIASFFAGWCNNAAIMMPGTDLALGTRIAISLAWVIVFLITVDLKDLVFGHDFFEVLAIYFFPFILAAGLPWTVSTWSLAIVIIGGMMMIGYLNGHVRDQV